MKTKSLKADIAKKDDNALVDFIRSERESLRTARFGTAGTKIAPSHVRKNIARALTARKAKTA